MRFTTSITAVSVLALASQVAAHGFVTSVVIDGKTFQGSNGNSPSSSSAVRKVSSGSPVQDVTSSDMGCGLDSQLASGMASANPGSLVQFYWEGETGIPWFHNTGPILTYMAACEGDCASFQPSSSTKWFKISELGEKEPATPDTWVQADINGGAPVNITIPTNIPGGDYLVRHEIIALQNSQSTGGAEFYPSCLQLSVSGSSGTADASTTVNFPGAYSATDPGILGNFYNPGVVYVMPGGPVSNFKDVLSDTDDVSGDAVSVKSSPTTATASATPTPSVTPVSSTDVPKNVAPTPSVSAIPSSVAPSESPSSPAAKSSATGSCKRKRSINTDEYVRQKARGVSMHKKRRLTLEH